MNPSITSCKPLGVYIKITYEIKDLKKSENYLIVS